MTAVEAFAPLEHGGLFYQLQGPADADLVVMLHGFSQTADGWRYCLGQVQALGYRTLTFDFYGSGRSACPPVAYTLDFYVQQVRDLLAYLQLSEQPITLIGSSMGGLISSVYTSRYGAHVERLVLINPAGVPHSAWELLNPKLLISRLVFMSVRNPLIGHAVSHLAVSLVRDVLHPLLATDDSDPEELNQQQRQLLQQQQQQQQQKQQQQQCTEAQQPLGQEQAEPSPAQPSPALPHKEKKSGWRVLKHLRARLNSAGIKQEILQEVMYGIGHDSEGYRKACVSTLRNINLMSDMSHVFRDIGQHDRPVLVVWGTDDGILPHSCSSALLEFMPRASRVSMRGAGHGPHCCPRASVEFNDHLATFLTKTVPRSRFDLLSSAPATDDRSSNRDSSLSSNSSTSGEDLNAELRASGASFVSDDTDSVLSADSTSTTSSAASTTTAVAVQMVKTLWARWLPERFVTRSTVVTVSAVSVLLSTTVVAGLTLVG